MGNLLKKWWLKYLIFIVWLFPAAIWDGIITSYLEFLQSQKPWNGNEDEAIRTFVNGVFSMILAWPLLAIIGTILTIISLRLIKDRNKLPAILFSLITVILFLIPILFFLFNVTNK